MLFLLALASESVFMLPFVLPRVFRPTYLAVFEISNFQLGTAFSAYGFTAIAAYFIGGPVADRYSPKSLLSGSLIFTGITGVYMASVPSFSLLVVLYVMWGISTILLFWSASMKAVRAILFQTPGRAFGSVDAARGLIAAIIASGSVWILALLLPSHVESASSQEQQQAFSSVIITFSCFIIFVGVLVWIFLKIPEVESRKTSSLSLKKVSFFIKSPLLWLQAIIVLCAYVGFKSTDDFSLFAYDVFQMNEVQASYLASVSFWMRPVGALLAGVVSDKVGYAKTAMLSFVILIISYFILSLGILSNSVWIIGLLTLAIASIGIYGVRGVYFALFKEAEIPLEVTGTAIGLVSVIGYTPDVFFGPIMGYLLDTYPEAVGHQYVFGVVACFACLGLFAAGLFEWLRYKSN